MTHDLYSLNFRKPAPAASDGSISQESGRSISGRSQNHSEPMRERDIEGVPRWRMPMFRHAPA